MIIGAVEGPVGGAGAGGALQRVTPEERAARFGQKAVTLWLHGENARDLAHRIERRLFDLGHACAVLDEALAGDDVSLVAHHLTAAGLICLCPLERSSTAEHSESAADWILDASGLEAEEVLRLLQEKGVLGA